jgi:hypothetical protein
MLKQQREMSKYVIVELHHILWETENGDGYLPFTEEDDDSVPTWETFHLNEEGQWTQEYIYSEPENMRQLKEAFGEDFDVNWHMKLVSIKGLDGNEGEKLLRLLNEETKKQQMEDDGVSEGDVVQGTTILSIVGKKLV